MENENSFSVGEESNQSLRWLLVPSLVMGKEDPLTSHLEHFHPTHHTEELFLPLKWIVILLQKAYCRCWVEERERRGKGKSLLLFSERVGGVTQPLYLHHTSSPSLLSSSIVSFNCRYLQMTRSFSLFFLLSFILALVSSSLQEEQTYHLEVSFSFCIH